jgi:hypothetical protein
MTTHSPGSTSRIWRRTRSEPAERHRPGAGPGGPGRPPDGPPGPVRGDRPPDHRVVPEGPARRPDRPPGDLPPVAGRVRKRGSDRPDRLIRFRDASGIGSGATGAQHSAGLAERLPRAPHSGATTGITAGLPSLSSASTSLTSPDCRTNSPGPAAERPARPSDPFGEGSSPAASKAHSRSEVPANPGLTSAGPGGAGGASTVYFSAGPCVRDHLGRGDPSRPRRVLCRGNPAKWGCPPHAGPARRRSGRPRGVRRASDPRRSDPSRGEGAATDPGYRTEGPWIRMGRSRAGESRTGISGTRPDRPSGL